MGQGGFTTVTGTITDPNGLKYSCGTISAQLVTAGGASATLNGGGFTTQTSPIGLGCPTSPGTGAPGSFTMRLADSGVIVPSNTTWRFTVNMTPGIAPPAGTGPQSFTVTTAINCSTNTPATCTANAMDISTLLSAAALALSTVGPPPSSTVAGLPSAASVPVGTLYQVTDALTQGNCSVGGGTSLALCRSNGVTWLPIGDGGGSSAFTSYVNPFTQFGITNNAKWVTDAVFNTAQTTCGTGTGLPAGTCITISATDPPFVCPSSYPCTTGGETGYQEFGTYGCNGANPGACIKAVPKGTITEIWDATHAQVSVAATHSSSGSMNNFAWGQAGNSARIQTMDTYLINNPGTAAAFPCGSANAGSGVTGGAGAVWLDANNSSNFSFGNHNYPVGLLGCANGGTIFISCPDPGPLNLLTDAGFELGNLPYPGGVGSGDQFSNLFFWGLGNDTGTNEGHQLVSVIGPAVLNNVWVWGYAWNVVNTYTINGLLLQQGTANFSGSYVGGNFPCAFGNGSFFPTKVSYAVCGGSNSQGVTITGSASSDGYTGVVIDSSYLYGNLSSIYGVVNSGSVPVTITGSYIGGLQATGTGTTTLIGNVIDRFNSSAPFAINNAGGTLIAEGNTINGQGNAFLSQSSGSFVDKCNKISNLTSPTITGGTYIDSCSATGTAPATGNFSLTNATFTSVAGTDQRHFTLNITASAAAAITIVYTFPTPFNVAPGTCHAQDIGGTNPLLTFSNSAAQTTTAVTFLSTATAVNTDTLQVAIDCN